MSGFEYSNEVRAFALELDIWILPEDGVDYRGEVADLLVQLIDRMITERLGGNA